tara:strand:+ start:22739 stop:23203 length:465 start_codon:yes stop_codon:yes gene_type:complete
MAKELRDIPTFTKRFWKGIGDETADRIRVHTTKDGKDVNGKKFQQYSTSYKARKASGKFKRQSSTSSKVDLQLTGDMMRNLQTRGFTKDNVVIGWSGANASKVEWNDDMGRTITSNVRPVSKGIERFILNEVDKHIEKNAREAVKKPINLKIGK